MKVLCVCENGNSRSVALAYLLKTDLKVEAIAIGLHTTSPATQAMLFDWADRIVLTYAPLQPLVPSQYAPKIRLYHVGPDRFFRGFSQELVAMFRERLKANPL